MICDATAEARTSAASDEAPTRAPRPQLRVFARDHDTRIKFIADGLPVQVGRLAETAFFETQGQAEGVAAEVALLLERTNGAPADVEGWHRVPIDEHRVVRPLSIVLPNLLRAARQAEWAGASAASLPIPLPSGEGAQSASVAARGGWGGHRWTLKRAAWLGFLIGLGWAPKRIARDELIQTTVNNVYRQARRFGLSVSEAPQGQVCIDLDVATLAVLDKAAALSHLQRDAFIKRILMRAAKEPARFGLVVG